MQGAYGVYAVTDFFRNGLDKEVQQGRAVAAAAARAGVEHFVFPSLALSEQNTGAYPISKRRSRSRGTSRS
jgi:hypothetical protein